MHMDPIMPVIVGVILAILLAALLMHTLRQPHVIAYLLAGILLGPSIFGLVTDQVTLDRLGQFGVIMLMFFIGMEVSPKKLFGSWKIALIGTLLQVAVSVLIIKALGYFFGWSNVFCILLGFIISLSSTAVVLNILQARNELDSSHGQNALTVLLAQDIAVIPMLIVIGLLSGNEVSTTEAALQIIGGVLLLGLCAFIVIRPDFKIPLIGHAIREDHDLQVFGALLLCFGLALISGLFSLSAALGAFIAGMVVATANEAKWVHHSLESFKTVFVAIFFVSIGMLVDVSFILPHWYEIVGLTLLVLILNTFINGAVFRLFGESWGNSLYTGAILAQIGEFSFVLAAVGQSATILSHDDYQVIVAVIVTSLLLSPFWTAYFEKFADMVALKQ